MFKQMLFIIKRKLLNIYMKLYPVSAARRLGVKIGLNCRLIKVNFGTEPYLITLGNHVSATRTTFITHDGATWCFREQFPEADLIKPITVGDNVFLGYGVIILPGVNIGNNVIIGAGAVVANDIPANCVAVGVPAKPVKTIEEYLNKNKKQFISTKAMDANTKRDYLLKHLVNTRSPFNGGL